MRLLFNIVPTTIVNNEFGANCWVGAGWVLALHPGKAREKARARDGAGYIYVIPRSRSLRLIVVLMCRSITKYRL